MAQTRFIFFHKTPTSGRTRFFRFAHGGVCGGEALPSLAQTMERPSQQIVVMHPAQLVQQAASEICISTDELEMEPAFHQWVDVANGPVQIFLIRFKGIDPPFSQAKEQNASFIELSEARGLAPVELELLRTAYECIMEG